MSHAWKNIAVFMDGSPAGVTIGRQAADLAKSHGAHLVGVFGVERSDLQHPADSFARGTAAIREVVVRHRVQQEARAAEAARHFAEIIDASDISAEFRVVWRDGLESDVLRNLHADLLVAAHPKPHDLPSGWSAEHLLLNTGGPLLLIPSEWSGQAPGSRVMIAWNGTPKARRAVNDALPLLTRAGRTTVLVVDGQDRPDRYGTEPGADVQAHLALHGVTADIRSVASDGARVADVIAAQARELDADLTVLGAYSRSRASEVLFGGVTRTLLSAVAGPLLISH